MEKDAGESLKYYLKVRRQQEDIAHIRHWTNLKVAFDDDSIWVKDLDYAQVHSVEVRSIPFKIAYYERSNRLFQLGHNLPERIVPSMLWTAIDRALPASLPSLNHNFFGTEELIKINFVATAAETDAVAMITSLKVLEQYLVAAPSIRLDKIRWALLPGDTALLLGIPLLPIPGDTFWNRKDQLIPTGYDFELFILSDHIQKKINPARDHWVLWDRDGHYSLIPKENTFPLSRGSFRASKI